MSVDLKDASQEKRQTWLSRAFSEPTTHYVLALLLIACAAVGSHLMLVSSLAELDEDSSTINMSGRQRMLTEQTLRLAGEMMAAGNLENVAQHREGIQFSLDLMRTSHRRLIEQVEQMPEASQEKVALQKAYFFDQPSLDDRMESYFSAVDELLASNPSDNNFNNPAYRAMLDAYHSGLVRDLDGVVKLYELQSKRRVNHSDRLHTYLTTAALLLLAFEALFIFKPLIRRLTKARDEVVSQNAEIAHMAVSDALTNLPNRSGFGHRLETLVRSKAGKETCAAIIMLDLDRFKNVNDTMGHPAGDQVLIEVGERLQDLLRSYDTVARLGGDEFAIILHRLTGHQDASEVAERIIESISRPIDIAGAKVNVGASIGIAIFPDTIGPSEELMKCADLALYQAKQSGRGQYCFYDPVMQKEVVRKSNLADELRKACDLDQLEVFLQPIFSIKTGKVEYAESLIRWRHHDRGLISAGEFIDIIDEFQMAPQLEAIVYRQVFGQLASWHRAGIECPKITLNVSGVNLRQPDFTQRLVECVHRYSASPDDITIEILESVFVDRGAETAITNIAKLHELGFEIMLDDFGTGFASLSHLTDLPIDGIKIDKSFVQGITTQSASEQIVSAVLALAQNLGIKSVAEGIESPDQLAYLHNKGCNFGQGYYFSKPITMDDFDGLLRMGAMGLNGGDAILNKQNARL